MILKRKLVFIIGSPPQKDINSCEFSFFISSHNSFNLIICYNSSCLDDVSQCVCSKQYLQLQLHEFVIVISIK
jgi:hypothetical protein